jgi:hypothetical protein
MSVRSFVASDEVASEAVTETTIETAIEASVDSLSHPRDPGLSQEFHCWPLPGYVWPALERRYHSIFCSEPHLRICGGLSPAIEAWVWRKEGRIAGLLLFEQRGTVAYVLNEVFIPTGEELAEFASAVFERHPLLTAVQVRGAAIDGKVPLYQSIRAPMSDDFVLTLPASVDAWMTSLSSQTREKLRYHLRRTLRKQPGFRFRTIGGAQIADAQLLRVIDFNRARMRKKGRRFAMGDDEEQGLRRVMRERGQLSLIEIDGEIRAGLLCTLAGRDIYMHVIAHDPDFDDLRLGFLCCVLTIQDAIAQGLARFHFLWGQYDYKTRLGGVRTDLYQLLLLRSPLAMLMHPRRISGLVAARLKAALRERVHGWRRA